VAEGPDCMPSTRLYEGDMGIILKLLDKMDGRISELSGKIAAIASDVQEYKVRGSRPTPVLSSCDQQRVQPAVNQMTGGGPLAGQLLAGQSDVAAEIPSWADMSQNRFAVPETSEDDDRRPYNEVVSKRAKRRRNQSQQLPSLQQQQQLSSSSSSSTQQQAGGQRPQSVAQPSQRQQHQQQEGRQRATRLLTGKAVTGERGRLGAASKIIKRAVFCIDNVDPSYSADDVRAFVSSLSVTVYTCFPAEPRRRRTDKPGPIADRKAFRLCIADADRAALLNEDVWPDSVTISTWYHKPPNQQRPSAVTDNTSVSASTTASAMTAAHTSATAAAATAVGGEQKSANNDEVQNSDHDMTVLYYNDGTDA